MTSGLTSTEVYCLAIDAKMPEMLYAGTSDGGVFRSADNGDHWQQTNSGLTSQNVWSLAVDPMARGTLYAGTTVGGLFRSTDSGDHWQSASADLMTRGVSSIAVSFSTPGTLYAGTGQGYVYRSTDFGAHWQMASTGLANATINSVVLTPMGPEKMYAAVAGSGVFRSVDSGDHWQQVVTGLVPQIRALAVNPGDTRAVYAGVNGGVFRSHDTGDSWEQLPIGGTVNALTIDLKTTSTVYAGTLDGVSGSTDGGDHWQSVLKSDSVYSLAVGPGTPAVVYAGTSSGEVLRSTDAGGHWTKITGGLTCSVVSCLAIGGNTVAFAGTDAGLFRSTDAGDHWEQLSKGQNVYCLAIDTRGSRDLYAGTGTGALRYSQGWTLTTAVTPDGGGAVTRSPDQALYPNGTVVTLTAVPSPGWRFVSWTGTTPDPTSPLKATVVMDADKSVTALFEPTESVPSAPALLSPADGSVVTTTSSTTAQVSLEWKVVGGATSYNFMLGSAKDFSGRILSGQASTTSKTTCDVTAPELSVGTTYYWRVAAVGAGGSSAWSPVFSFTVVQQGQTVTTLTLRLGSSVMTVSGNDGSSSSVTLDAAPVLGAGNRTLVPIRAVAEAMGGVVDWNAATKTATVRVGTNTLELTLGKSVAVFNGSPKQIDADPKVLPLIINGRTMLPLRFVVESLGANVAYDQATKTITITYTKS